MGSQTRKVEPRPTSLSTVMSPPIKGEPVVGPLPLSLDLRDDIAIKERHRVKEHDAQEVRRGPKWRVGEVPHWRR